MLNVLMNQLWEPRFLMEIMWIVLYAIQSIKQDTEATPSPSPQIWTELERQKWRRAGLL